MEGAASILVLLIVAAFAGFAGLGIMLGAGSEKKDKKEGGGMNLGKIVAIIIIGLAIAMWLSAPGTDQQIADVIKSIWGNVVRGLQPLVSIVVQLAFLGALGYGVYLLVRRMRRR